MMLEVCVDNITSVRNAFIGGADRIELCSALSEGGTTPTVGFLSITRHVTSPDFPIFSMIRPRGGNFIYTEDELLIMERDIKFLKENGTNGFVFGLLTKDNKVDMENCRRLLSLAKPLPCTFHRAFDQLTDAAEGLESIIQLGFERLLTSGQAETAEAGKELISRLVAQSNGRIIVMPGAGVSPNNLQSILQTTRAVEFHGSAKGSNDDCGSPVTSDEVVRSLKRILEQPL